MLKCTVTSVVTSQGICLSSLQIICTVTSLVINFNTN